MWDLYPSIPESRRWVAERIIDEWVSGNRTYEIMVRRLEELAEK